MLQRAITDMSGGKSVDTTDRQNLSLESSRCCVTKKFVECRHVPFLQDCLRCQPMAIYVKVNSFWLVSLDYLTGSNVSIMSVDVKDPLATPTKSEISYRALVASDATQDRFRAQFLKAIIHHG